MRWVLSFRSSSETAWFKDYGHRIVSVPYLADNQHRGIAKLRLLSGGRWEDLFHLSHRSNLIRKDRAYLKVFGPVPEDLPYVWPVP